MCGIAISINKPVDTMLGMVDHRGPDSRNVWQCENISIGHTRLSILDLTNSGAQPMESSRYVLSFNGEIYSYLEMKSRLCKNDDLGLSELPGGNDAKTFLLYIEQFGLDAAIRDANGMFAFILYDKINHIVHMAVDRFAQKPLYWYQSGEIFAAASTPAALLHLKDKWKINELAKQSYFLLGGVMVDSIFEGIYRVAAAEKLTYNIRTKEIKKEFYWKPSFVSNTSDIEDLVLDSIRKVQVADVPVYIFLSGGIDSTVVASQFAGKHAIHMEGPEMVYARHAADKFGIKLHLVSPKTADPVEIMTDYVKKCGEPSMSGIIPYLVSREAAKLCKVAVTANGADELFFGYDRTTDEITEKQVRHIFRDFSGNGVGIKCHYLDPRLSKGRWMELMTYVQHDLNRTLDFASMANSLEVRSPFLDHRLVEMALSIPQKGHGRKEILKNILRKKGFNEEFLNRPKLGFSLYKKPENYDRLQDEAFDWCIKQGHIPLRPYGPRDRSYLRASAFGFKIWYENYKTILE